MRTQKQIISGTIVFAVVVLSAIAYAAEETAKDPQWWEVIGGILAIPATLIGLAYSYVLIRKTRLEARRTELEIREKEAQLGELTEQPEVAERIIAPIVEARQGQFLLMRFVLLYVVLGLWGIATSLYGTVTGGIVFGLERAKLLSFDDSWVMWVFFVISKLPDVVTWVIVVGIGWPLFRDLNTIFKVDLKAIFLPWKREIT